MARVVAPPMAYDTVSSGSYQSTVGGSYQNTVGPAVYSSNAGCCGLGGSANPQVIEGGGPGFVGGQAGMAGIQGGRMVGVQGPNGGTLMAAQQAGIAGVAGSGMMAGGQSMAVAVPPGDPCGCGPGASAGDCSGTCGGAETMCCEPAGGVAQVTWVASGAGPYAQTTSYQYVGEGMGMYDRQVVVNWYGWRFRKCCLGLLCLLLLPLLLYGLYLLFTDDEPVVGTTGQPENPQLGPVSTCTVFGDPHVRTFDGKRADYYTEGEYWIVRSDNVLIQGAYKPTRMTASLSVTKQIAISGAFINNHKLIITVDEITWDGAPVIHGFEPLGGHWHSANPEVYITYNGQGTVMQNSRVGKSLHVVHVSLPFDIKIEVNRWAEPNEGHYINARITMPKMPNQDGHCGNFNGNPEDDARVQVRARVGRTGVPAEQLLFPFPKTPINPNSNRPDLNDCPEGMLKIAMDKCKAAEHKFFPSKACLIDNCLGHMAPVPV